MSTAAAPEKQSLLLTVFAWFCMFGGVGVTLAGILTWPVNAGIVSLSSIVGGAAAVAAGYGLRHRSEWARQTFIGVQVFSALRAFAIAMFPAARLSAAFRRTGQSINALPPDELKAAVAAARSGLLLDATVVTIVSVVVILWLSSRRVKAEFANEDA